jgi:small GTP-binding protein
MLVKLILVGDSGVGKTHFLSRFVNDQFNPESKTTIGVEFATKRFRVGDKSIKAQIWDTAGQERYRSVTTSYYKGAAGALLLYDTTSSQTFASVPRWVEETRAHAEPSILIVLIGNKIDQTEARSVSTTEGKNYAERNQLLFFEASAKDATNVEAAFMELVTEIVEGNANVKLAQLKEASEAREVKLGAAVSEEKNGCC